MSVGLSKIAFVSGTVVGGFTGEQVSNLRSVRLSSIICANTETIKAREFALDLRSREIDCKQLSARLDFNLFDEK